MKRSFSDYLAKISQKKSLYAWITFVILSILTLVDISSQYFRMAVIVFLFTLLLTILDTHKRVALVFRTRYSGIQDAWNDIETEVTRAFNKKKVILSWHGITLGDAWPQIRKIIEPYFKNERLPQIEINFTQLEPDYLDEICGIDSGLSKRAEATFLEINSFKKKYKAIISKTNSKIEIFRYKYMPNFHGLLINESLLFLSHVRWDNNFLYVADEPYEKHNINSDNGLYKIELFKSWLKKAMYDKKLV